MPQLHGVWLAYLNLLDERRRLIKVAIPYPVRMHYEVGDSHPFLCWAFAQLTDHVRGREREPIRTPDGPGDPPQSDGRPSML